MKRYLHAGFTVETALLLPMILSVILIVLYFNISLYNRVVMQAAVCRGAQKVFFYEFQGHDEIEGKCANIVLNEIKKSLVCMKDINVEVSVSEESVSVFVEGELNVPGVIYLEPLVSRDFWKIKVEWTEKRLHAPTMVKRTYHTIRVLKLAELGGQ